MQRHFIIEQFAHVGKSRHLPVKTQQPAVPAALGQGTKHRFRPAADGAVGQDQVDGLLQVLAGNFGKPAGQRFVLEWKIIHRLAGGVFPTRDPTAAELAIAVKDQQRFGRRRLNGKLLQQRGVCPVAGQSPATL